MLLDSLLFVTLVDVYTVHLSCRQVAKLAQETRQRAALEGKSTI